MKRRDARDKLMDYAEGALDPREARELEALLAADPALAREARETGEALAAFRDRRAEPPAGYHDHLAARLVARMRQEGVAFGRSPRESLWERARGFLLSLETGQVLAAATVVFFVVLGARVVVHRLDQVPRDVALGSPVHPEEGAQDAWTPPDDEIASLTDREARAVADRLAAELDARIAGDLAANAQDAAEPYPSESAVTGEIVEMDDAARRTLYAELGRELSLPL